MDLYGKKDKSIAQKTVIIALETIILAISGWILFGGGYHTIFSSSGLNVSPEQSSRRVILFAFNCIIFLRMIITIAYLVKRHIPWAEAMDIPFAFALYYIGFAMLGYSTDILPGPLDFLAIAIFLTGSFLNTYSELQRDKWKKNPENKGRLYTIGLFKYSIHINYFGDLLWVIAYAIITRNWYSALIPAFLFCFFAFYNIPMLDKHLASHYGEQFEEYRKKTKKFIPFIY